MARRSHMPTLFFLILATGAAYLFFAEAVIATSILPDRVTARLIPSGDVPTRQYSLQSAHDRLMRCDRALTAPINEDQPDAPPPKTHQKCRKIAENTLILMPSHGFAHLIMARLTSKTSDQEIQRVHLINSTRYAPFEGWIAERRFILAANKIDWHANDRLMRRDLGVLLTSQSGAEFLSDYYVSRPEMRSMISSGVGLATAADRRRFLNLMTKILDAS